jgi:hypothetical protein
MARVRPVVAAVLVETVGDDWSKAESDDGTGGCWSGTASASTVPEASEY